LEGQYFPVNRLFFRWHDGFFESFGRSDFCNGLCRDLDCFTGCRVPPHPSVSFDEDGFADAGEHKGSLFLRNRQCCVLINDGCSGQFGQLLLDGALLLQEIVFLLQAGYLLLQEGDLLVFEGCFFIDAQQSLGVTRSITPLA
jgi:hypothetical protein